MKRTLLSLLVIVVLVALAAPALAQDSVPTPTITPTPSPTAPPPVVFPPVQDEVPGQYPEFIQNLLRQLSDVTFLPFLAFGIPVFVAAIKYALALLKVEVRGGMAVLIALSVQVVVWLAYTLAQRSGFGDQFLPWYEIVVNLVKNLLPLGLGAVGVHTVYTQAQKREWPVLGYKGYRKPKTITLTKAEG